MTLSASKRRVLETLATTVPETVDWCVFGSVDSVLWGLDEEPSDVDVIVTPEGAGTLRDRLPDAFVGTRAVGRSRIDDYRLHGEELEVVYDDGETDGRLIDLERVELRRVELDPASDLAVPALPLDRLTAVYRKIGKGGTAAKLDARVAE